MTIASRVAPCLWFDDKALEAAEFYCSIFPNSRVTDVSYYSEAGPLPAGTVLMVVFELDGVTVTILNGGSAAQFTEATSMMVMCDTQAEIDHYWERLRDGGGSTQQCGWLKDKYGFSWQIAPRKITEWIGPNAPKGAAERVFACFMPMVKLDMEAMERAYQGV